MSDTVTNPHDLIFKQFYGNPAATAEFLRHNLPPDMAQAIDFATIEPVRDTFVSEDLKNYFADLIFSCSLKDGGQGSIYLLFEHKSAPEPACALQVLRYMHLLWDRLAQGAACMLPVVIPIVIYHGQRAWNGRQLRAFFPSGSTFEACIPAFTMTLFDLSHLSEDDIKGGLSGKALLLLLKALQTRQPEAKIAALFELLFAASGPDTALQTIERFMRYIFGVSDAISRQALETELRKTSQGESIMESVAVKIFPEAYEQGLQEGRTEGRAEGYHDLLGYFLDKRFGHGVLDMRIQERLRQASPAQLELWTKRMLDARTLSDIFDE